MPLMRCLALLCILSNFAAAADREDLGVVALQISSPQAQLTDSKDEQRTASGEENLSPFLLRFNALSQTTSFTGMRISGTSFHIEAIAYYRNYEEIFPQLKKRVVVEVPTGVQLRVTKMTRKRVGPLVYDEPSIDVKPEMKKIDRETVVPLPKLSHIKLGIRSKKPVDLGLPKTIALSLVLSDKKTQLRIVDKAAIQKALVANALSLLDDRTFDDFFEFDFPAGAKEIADIFRGKLLDEMRKIVIRELSRPAFIDKFTDNLTKTFDALPLTTGLEPVSFTAVQNENDWVIQRAGSEAISDELFTKNLSANTAQLSLEESSLNFLLRHSLPRVPGFTLREKDQTTWYLPHDDAEASLIQRFFSNYSTKLKPSQNYQVGITLTESEAPTLVPWQKDSHRYLELKAKFSLAEVEHPETVIDEIHIQFRFEISSTGGLQLVRISGPSAESPTTANVPQFLKTGVQSWILTSVLNQRLLAELPKVKNREGIEEPSVSFRLQGEAGNLSEEGASRRAKHLVIQFLIH